MTIIVLVCALNIAREHCDEHSARNFLVFPQAGVVCLIAPLGDEFDDLYDSKTEYLKIRCDNGRRT